MVCAPAPAETWKADGLTANAELPVEMFVTMRAAFPTFPTVNVFCVGVPTVTFPKASDVAEIEATGADVEVPVPETETVDGLPVALCTRVMVAE